MNNTAQVLQSVKKAVLAGYPNATLILYGSYARGEQREDSDMDILVLIDKENVTHEDRKTIINALFAIQLENGILISPMIYPKKLWGNSHGKDTAFYNNVAREGVLL